MTSVHFDYKKGENKNNFVRERKSVLYAVQKRMTGNCGKNAFSRCLVVLRNMRTESY